MTQPRPPLSLFFIGERSLLILCAEHVLSHGHTIQGIAAEGGEIRKWATDRSIPIVEPHRERLIESLSREPCDYLFSVINERVLSEEVLRLPTKGAINYHDGPLPQYCGIRVTTWALINQERQHGVTWHQMTGTIDGGCVLKEKQLSIAADETAFTLNAKCFEAAFEAFQELMGDLEQGIDSQRAQNTSVERGYFGRRKRPGRMAVLNWSNPAEELDALFRGLDFGRFENPIGCAKLLWGDRVLIPRRLTVLERGSTQPPGTIETGGDPDTVCVHTSTKIVELAGIQTLDGRPVDVSSLPRLAVGVNGSSKLNGEVSPGLDLLWEQVGIHEPYWVARLIEREPVTLPYIGCDISRDHCSGKRVRHELDFGHFRGPDLHDPEESPSFVVRGVAAVSLYLGRLSGKEVFDLDVQGTSFQRLPRQSAAFFANAVPIRFRLTWSDSFIEHVRHVEDAIARAEKHGTYLRDLVLRYPQFTDDHRQKLRDVPDVAVVIAPTDGKNVQDLPQAQLVLAISETEPRITLIANPDVIGEDLLLKIAEEIEHLLSQTATNPQLPLASFSVVTPRELAILECWNDETSVVYEANSLPHGFEVQTEKTPEATALVFQGESLTYRELNTRANQLAHLLMGRGVSRGDRVGVLMDRSIDMVIALFGVLKTGAAYVPLDPKYPPARLAIMAEDSDAALILTRERHLSHIEPVNTQKLIFEGLKTLRGFGCDNPTTTIEPNDVAYVMYTSGSTGRPKGVMVTHGNIANLFSGMDRPFGREAGGTCLAVTSISFDISVLELFWTLTRGFQVVLFNAGNSADTPRSTSRHPDKKLDFSLFLSDTAAAEESCGGGPAQFLIEARRWAAESDFAGVRTPDDFLVRPEDRSQVLSTFFGSRGKAVSLADSDANESSQSSQRRDRAVWIPSDSDPQAFRRAAQEGAPIVTELFGKSVEVIAKGIALYRRTWKETGRVGEGHVILMSHTLVGHDEAAVRSAANGPIKTHLQGTPSLLRDAAWDFPAFQQSLEAAGGGRTIDEFFATISEAGANELLVFACERYYSTRGLFGTPAGCLAMVDRLKEIGVDEIGCLIDFGLETEKICEHLPALKELRLAANPGSRSEVEEIAALIEQHKVTHLYSTPSLATMLTWNDRSRKALSNLRVMVCGGEAMSEELARQLRSSVAGRVFNIYGPTETTVYSTSYEVTEGMTGPVPIGKPVANTQLYVVDDRQLLLPIGIPGELMIAGDGVGRGYLKNPELTAARFLQDGRGKMYRTGDLVQMRHDGAVEFLGRFDHQVKIRGHRIELGEIESVLQSAPGVRKAVVHPQEDASGGKRLVAYVVAASSSEACQNDLREFVRARLPEYMVPSVVELLPDLPLTPSGKVDRRALPKPTSRRRTSQSDRSSTTPLTETQHTLVELWKRLLDVPEVDLGDNFFDLGGHSLLAMRGISEIEKRFGARLTTRMLLVSSLSQLAAEIDSQGRSGQKPSCGKEPDAAHNGLGRFARWLRDKLNRPPALG